MESAPIMMSATTTPDPKTAGQLKNMATKLLRASNNDLRSRLIILHSKGWVDQAMKSEIEAKIGDIQLSMAEVSLIGDLPPSLPSMWIEAYERQAKSGKPGPFAAKDAAPKRIAPANPLKPISSGVALSASLDEVVVEHPDLVDETASRRKAQEKAGDELAAYAGCTPKAA